MAMVSISNTINGSADIVSDAYHKLCSFTPPVGTNLIIATVFFSFKQYRISQYRNIV